MHADCFGRTLLLALCVASTLQDDTVPRRTINKCCLPDEHLYFSLKSGLFECENTLQKAARAEETDPLVATSLEGITKLLEALNTESGVFLAEGDVVVGVVPSCLPDDTDWLFANQGFQVRMTPNAVMLHASPRHEFPAHAWCVDLDDEDDLMAILCPCAGVCVRKCCPHGEAFDKRLSECVASGDAPWWPTSADPNATHYLLTNKVPHSCEPLSAETFHHGQFTILPDGSTKGRDSVGRDTKFAAGRFCVDPTNSSETDADLLVLFCIETDALSDAVTIFKGVVTLVGAFALLVTVVLTVILPEMRQNIHGKMALCHNASLMGAFVCIGVAQVSALSENSCKVLSFLIQFTLLAAFFWLNAMCIEISWSFMSLRPSRKPISGYVSGGKFIWYSVYAWGATSVISVITLIVELTPEAKLRPRFGEANCFFHGDDKIPQLLFLFGPMAILLAINLGLFVFTATKITLLRRQTSQGSQINRRNKQNLVLYMKLFTLMGVTWVFEIISWAVGGKNYYWLLIDCVNLLRGVFIFFIFCWKRTVLDLVRARVCCVVVRDGAQDSADSKLTATSQEAHEMVGDMR